MDKAEILEILNAALICAHKIFVTDKERIYLK